jgi:hypothetical protein
MTTLNRTVCKLRRQLFTVVLLLSAIGLLSSLSYAQNIAAGCDDKGTPVTIDDNDNWVTLCKVTVDVPGGTHTCIATGSAYVSNTVAAGGHNEYRFNIARSKHPVTDMPGELLIDVIQNIDSSILDLKDQPLAVAQHFDSVPAGTRNFYWLARKVSTDSENIDAKHFSMGVVCTDGT